jgi:hypothetical protein
MSSDLTVETLYKRSKIKIVVDQINELELSLLARIVECHSSGLSSTVYPLPDAFAGPYEPADACLMVYSTLIERMKNRGFIVALLRDSKFNSSLEVKWPSCFDPVEKNRMKRIITDHLKLAN